MKIETQTTRFWLAVLALFVSNDFWQLLSVHTQLVDLIFPSFRCRGPSNLTSHKRRLLHNEPDSTANRKLSKTANNKTVEIELESGTLMRNTTDTHNSVVWKKKTILAMSSIR
jgi:hypothetical protein